MILGIGGSATTDGGFGMLTALSMEFSPHPAQAAETVEAAFPQAPLSESLPRIPPGSIPVLGKPMEQLMDFPFTPSEAFIVSRINGTWDVRSIGRISPFPEAEVTRIFHKLHKSGVITFK